MWDLIWLQQQGATINVGLVRQKLTDYKIDNFEHRLQHRIDSLPDIIAAKHFHNEMKRFIPLSVYETSLGKSGFSAFLLDNLRELLSQVKKELYEAGDKSEVFRL